VVLESTHLLNYLLVIACSWLCCQASLKWNPFSEKVCICVKCIIVFQVAIKYVPTSEKLKLTVKVKYSMVFGVTFEKSCW